MKSASLALGGGYSGFWGTTAADINRDGINDIVGLSNDQTYIYEGVAWLGNPDGSYQSTPLKFPTGTGPSASDLVTSDYNRDGKIDFAVVTPGQN